MIMSAQARLVLLLLIAALVPSCGGKGSSGVAAGPAFIPGTGGGNVGPGFGGGGLQPGVVFTADRNVSAIPELFAADLAGITIVNLSGPLVTANGVTAFKWSPDRTRVAFTATRESGIENLYVVPAVGGSPVRISPPSNWGTPILSFDWSADSTVVGFVHRDDVFVFNVVLYMASGDGSGSAVPVAPSTGVPPIFKFSPDPASHSFLYLSDPRGGDVRQDFSGTVLASNVTLFDWAPNGQGFAYVEAFGFPLKTYLFASGGHTLATSINSGTSPVPYFLWSPDSTRVAFTSNVAAPPRMDLWICNADGSGPLLLAAPTPSTGRIWEYRWAPDNSLISFVADLNTSAHGELYTVQPTGSGLTKINPIISGGVATAAWSTDSSTIAYSADASGTGRLDLFAASPTTAGSGTLLDTGQVTSFSWQPGVLALAYAMSTHQVKLVSAVTPSPQLLSGATFAIGDRMAWDSAGTHLAYPIDGLHEDLAVSNLTAPQVNVTGPSRENFVNFQIRYRS
jgi:Tol biopolymer transport system component